MFVRQKNYISYRKSISNKSPDMVPINADVSVALMAQDLYTRWTCPMETSTGMSFLDSLPYSHTRKL
jgi:hypothetical protein